MGKGTFEYRVQHMKKMRRSYRRIAEGLNLIIPLVEGAELRSELEHILEGVVSEIEKVNSRLVELRSQIER